MNPLSVRILILKYIYFCPTFSSVRAGLGIDTLVCQKVSPDIFMTFVLDTHGPQWMNSDVPPTFHLTPPSGTVLTILHKNTQTHRNHFDPERRGCFQDFHFVKCFAVSSLFSGSELAVTETAGLDNKHTHIYFSFPDFSTSSSSH